MAGSPPTGQHLYNQLQDLQTELGKFNLGMAPEAIRSELNKRVGNFKPLYEDVAQQQNKAYSLPAEIMAGYENRQNAGDFLSPGIQGTQFTGIGPLAQLGAGLGEIGNQFARANAAQGGLDFQKARLEDIISNIGNQYNLNYQQKNQMYQNLLPLYQNQTQIEEAARQRDFQAQQDAIARDFAAQENARNRSVSGGGGGGGGLTSQDIQDIFGVGGGDNTQPEDYFSKVPSSIQKYLSNINQAKKNGKENMVENYRKAAIQVFKNNPELQKLPKSFLDQLYQEILSAQPGYSNL